MGFGGIMATATAAAGTFAFAPKALELFGYNVDAAKEELKNFSSKLQANEVDGKFSVNALWKTIKDLAHDMVEAAKKPKEEKTAEGTETTGDVKEAETVEDEAKEETLPKEEVAEATDASVEKAKESESKESNMDTIDKSTDTWYTNVADFLDACTPVGAMRRTAHWLSNKRARQAEAEIGVSADSSSQEQVENPQAGG